MLLPSNGCNQMAITNDMCVEYQTEMLFVKMNIEFAPQ